MRRFYQNKISFQANGTFSTLNKNSHFIAKLQAHTIRLAASAGKNFENLAIVVDCTHLPKYSILQMLKIILIIAAAIHTAAIFGDTGKIDRRATVERHTVKYVGNSARKSDSPSQVGNGKFAFGFDRTGLQTLSAQNTLSDWAWHSTPPP